MKLSELIPVAVVMNYEGSYTKIAIEKGRAVEVGKIIFKKEDKENEE